jgi:hypothetical protein
MSTESRDSAGSALAPCWLDSRLSATAAHASTAKNNRIVIRFNLLLPGWNLRRDPGRRAAAGAHDAKPSCAPAIIPPAIAGECYCPSTGGKASGERRAGGERTGTMAAAFRLPTRATLAYNRMWQWVWSRAPRCLAPAVSAVRGLWFAFRLLASRQRYAIHKRNRRQNIADFPFGYGEPGVLGAYHLLASHPHHWLVP